MQQNPWYLHHPSQSEGHAPGGAALGAALDLSSTWGHGNVSGEVSGSPQGVS